MACRGSVIKLNSKGTCAYKVQGWAAPKAFKDSLLTIDNIEVTEQDIATPITAIDDYRSLYSFGKGFGKISVQGSIYLGPVDKKGDNVIGKIKSAFASLRLSSSKKPKNVSITSGYKCKAYFQTLTFGTADTEFNKMTYVISGIVAPTPK